MMKNVTVYSATIRRAIRSRIRQLYARLVYTPALAQCTLTLQRLKIPVIFTARNETVGARGVYLALQFTES